MEHGLFSFDGKTTRSEVSREALKKAALFGEYSKDADRSSIWIAGQHGVFRIRDGQAEKIIEAETFATYFADDKNVWAATTAHKESFLHPRYDERFGWLTSAVGFEQGLPSEKAFAVTPLSEGLLIATNRGVVTYRPGTVAPKLIATRLLSQRMRDLGELRRRSLSIIRKTLWSLRSRGKAVEHFLKSSSMRSF